MSENTILLAGIFCFALAVIGMVLTVLEFRRMGIASSTKAEREPVRRTAARPAFRT
jgi:hypothetical protein